MEYADEKRRLYHLAVVQGLDADYDFTQLTNVPAPLVRQWVKKFFAPQQLIQYSATPRLVNRFALGADPEFVFSTFKGGYFHAERLGMNTILPFGCDMAGRQAELRAHSSRFALEVIASLVDALRWIPRFYATQELLWLAQPYMANDGVGGHVHFGRKRPTRELEIDILDAGMHLLSATGVFDDEGTAERRRQTKFGGTGDIRLQSHGYEYRSYPTWLSSPWQAYFTVVASKLMLHFGVRIPPIRGKEGIQLLNLFRMYRYLDDDAAIALRAYHLKGLPEHDATCFKERWGVKERDNLEKLYGELSKDYFFPLSLIPEETTKQELFSAFVSGAVLPVRRPVATWKPFNLGKGFQNVKVQPHIFELPNVAQGLVSKHYAVTLSRSDREPSVVIICRKNLLDTRRIRQVIGSIGVHVDFLESQSLEMNIQVPRGLLEARNQVRLFRDIISDTTLFPICEGEKLELVNWAVWDNPRVQEAVPLQGKILLQSQGQKVAPKPMQMMYREEF